MTAPAQQAALAAFKQAFAAYPNVKVGVGGHGTNTVYVIKVTPNSPLCGGTKSIQPNWSNVFWPTVMAQAQWALNLQEPNPDQNLLQATGTGVGTIAAHEIGHELDLPNMDDPDHAELVYPDEYNDGNCDGGNSPWLYTGQSRGVPIHWAPASDQALKKLGE